MGKTVENPKRYIVSCRVSDREMQLLADRAEQGNTNISDLLRQSLTAIAEGFGTPNHAGA
jgi:hypothetical protein